MKTKNIIMLLLAVCLCLCLCACGDGPDGKKSAPAQVTPVGMTEAVNNEVQNTQAADTEAKDAEEAAPAVIPTHAEEELQAPEKGQKNNGGLDR